jgi:hypothetical protein
MTEKKLCPLLKLQEQCRGEECAFYVGEVTVRGSDAGTGESVFEVSGGMSNRCAIQILGTKAMFDYLLETYRLRL